MFTKSPNIIGKTEIPHNLRNYEGFSRNVADALPKLQFGQCVAIEFETREDLIVGRKQVLSAGMHRFGSGHVQTGSRNTTLYVWLKDTERARAIKATLVIVDANAVPVPGELS